MPQKTDLNVAPYYDDFSQDKNFHRILFRPGFAVQARELTQLQSILQNQFERFGSHIFQEGDTVLPAQISTSDSYQSIQLSSAFAGETIVPSQYYNATTPVIVTGATSGVKARVVGFKNATATTQPLLYVQYVTAGADGSSTVFSNSENITANAAITHTTAYSANTASATTHSTSAAQTGTAVTIGDGGVYFIKGTFVQADEQTVVISDTSTSVDARVGFTITETLETPESDTSLTDNATGSSNFAAKGAHRLKITLTLASLDTTSTADSDFIELVRLRASQPLTDSRPTEYSVLGNTLARRTFDESGDYTVRPFQFEAKESLTSRVKGEDFDGVYSIGDTTDDGNTASSTNFVLSVSPGKAYVKGYEVEKTASTRLDVPKARNFDTVDAGAINAELGNFVKITNIYGQPDVSSISSETTPYNTIGLFDDAIVTRGSSSGTHIGVCRARTIQYESGTKGNTDAIYRLYLFDVRPFTYLTLSGTPSATLTANHSNGGVQVKGVTSGATGFVFGSLTSGTTVVLTNVVGAFSSGEKITASDSSETDQIVEDSGNTDLTISEITTHKFTDTRSLFMDDADAGQDFTADIALTIGVISQILLDGTDANSVNAGDNIVLEEDNSTTVALESESTAVLQESEKNVSIYKLPKKVVKTLLTTDNSGVSDTQINIRRQFIGTTNSSGVVSFTAGSGETFLAHTQADYTLTILTAGSGSGGQGDVVDIADTISGTGTSTITITDNSILANAAKVKLTATILRTAITSRVKTTTLSKQLKVLGATAGDYGTKATDKDISLGRADAFRLQAVYDSEDTSTDASIPQMTISGITGTFVRGERITGATSGAAARVVNTTSPMTYTLVHGNGATDFTAGETITGSGSAATATVGTLTAGSKVITSNFTLDTGQRDNFYDIARIVRKADAPAPRGRLLVVFDFFSHSGGSFFSVDSYSDTGAKQMEYDDIPTYTATRVDPDEPEPTGLFPLTDCIDFRPTVEDIAGASSTDSTVDTITAKSFDFFHRQFDGTGATVVDTPKPNTIGTLDFEHFLPQRATIYLTEKGNFSTILGTPSENPQTPKELDNAFKLAELFIPAFTFKPTDITITRLKTQRFTMKDIGKLQTRIDNLEYYTNLSLLERDAESFEIQDANGLNRFKSGFIVDNFAGHRVGDVKNIDYKNSIDQAKKELRPKCVMRNVELEESVSTDALRAAAGYQKTGDVFTLPYTSTTLSENPYASRTERVLADYVPNWIGHIELKPDADTWFETDRRPDLVINVDGNFDSVLAANENQVGTIWNNWETQWSGVVGSRQETAREGNFEITRTIQTTRSDLTRTGIKTEVIEQIDEESLGDKILSKAIIPFMRPVNIEFTGTGFFPNVRVYVYFDGVDMSNFVTPNSSAYTTDTTIVEGSALVTTAFGEIKGTLRIPETKFTGQETVPKFKTGEKEFRITSSSSNRRMPFPTTAGSTIFSAKGIIETVQENIVATRNAKIVQTTVSDTTTATDTSSRIINRSRIDNDNNNNNSGEVIREIRDKGEVVFKGDPPSRNKNCHPADDPLAQTFMVEEDGGCFITSLDIYFSAKDEDTPCWIEIRNTVNGYPGPKILPFGRKLLEPADINVSTDASVATTFTFDSPVYLKEGAEYSVVVRAHTIIPRVWISKMGEVDVSGTRLISKQPHLGVLYKSQNNRSWRPSYAEDLKFTVRKAVFTRGTTGTVTLQNKDIGDSYTNEIGTSDKGRRLKTNPLNMVNSSAVLQVRHQDHGMYSTSNNVTISGASSGVSTTLNGAITAASTSLTLTSATGFEASNLSSRCYVKIGNEIMFGTLSSTTISSLSRGQASSTAAAHADDATVELYQIFKTPLDQINKTHTAIANIGMDSYTVALTTAPTISGNSTDSQVGGINVYASENFRYENIKTNISALELPETAVSGSIQPMSGTSPSGSETSFTATTTGNAVGTPLNENFRFFTSKIVASKINETNENSGTKSLFLPIDLRTTNENVSPVIDTNRLSMLAIANRINNIDSSSDVYPTTDFVASTEPNGDQNSFIYITKKIALENPASALKVFFSAHKHNSSDIKVLFKTLRTDDASDFDELGYTFFNTTGTTDNTVLSSLDIDDFQEYKFTAGITDDGVGEPLPTFIQFAIKIVGQGTNAAEPVRIKDFRAIALAT